MRTRGCMPHTRSRQQRRALVIVLHGYDCDYCPTLDVQVGESCLIRFALGWRRWELRVGVISVEEEVLSYKANIEYDAQEGEAELDGVACNRGPVVIPESIDKQLDKGESTARKIEEDIPD